MTLSGIHFGKHANPLKIRPALWARLNQALNAPQHIQQRQAQNSRRVSSLKLPGQSGRILKNNSRIMIYQPDGLDYIFDLPGKLLSVEEVISDDLPAESRPAKRQDVLAASGLIRLALNRLSKKANNTF
ncbi:MAG: hypothetical protein VKJ06_04900 [Vampirovibrionales bacterium]|nr:hypothetical protein [Vampirovibrionales bacterium]